MRLFGLLLLLLALPADAKKPKKEKAPAPEATPLVPQATGQSFELPCNYVPGATWRFVEEETSVETAPGQPEDRTVTREEFTVRVDAWDGKVLTATLQSDKVELLDPPNDPREQRLYQEMSKIDFPDIILEYAHDAGMSRVTNVDVLVRESTVAFEAARPIFEEMAAELPEEHRARFMEGLMALVTNPAMLTKSAIEGGQALFAYTCLGLTSGTYDYASQLPNPFGGAPFPSRGTLVVGDPEPDRARMVDALVLDPVAAMTVVRPMLETMGVPVPPEAVPADFQLDVSVRTDVAISRADGWPIGWTTERRVGAAGSLKVERSVVSRME